MLKSSHLTAIQGALQSLIRAVVCLSLSLTFSFAALAMDTPAGNLSTPVAYTPAAFTLDSRHQIPSVLPVASPNGDRIHALVVDKSRQQLSVFVHNGRLKELYRFECSTGQIQGRKEQEGDKKTPEGIYFINDHHEKQELSETYGTRAFPLDYPNRFDQRSHRSGYAIWIHGTNKALKPRDSNGCIVLANPDIDQLAQLIELERTPVIVVDRLDYVLPHQAFVEAEMIRQSLSRWRRNLSQMDYEANVGLWAGSQDLWSELWQRWQDYRQAHDP
ncbi:MAG: L,D-transpeptidase, partial [Desulfobacterales bacterium]